MPSLTTTRQLLRTKRRALDPTTRQEAAESFAWHFARCRLYRNSRRIACYLSHDGELDLMPLIQRAWRDKKQVYLPVLHAPYVDRLLFARYTPQSILGNNRFGIPEPALAARERISPMHLDLVLTPLVGFDCQGHRLGMGGGFYDRSFAFLRHRQFWHKPRLVGCAYQFQEVAHIESRSWDVPLQAVATEYGVAFERRNGI